MAPLAGHQTLLITTLLASLVSFVPSQGVAGSPQRALLVAAAADLASAFREITPLFEQQHQAKVTLTFGSTGQLAQQIQHGAPVDVFFAANVAFVEDLRAKGAIIADSLELYAQGRIVLATHRTRQGLAGLKDLTRVDVKRIAIANPTHAPYGIAAREALVSAGV
ncbi:MAG TPA: molybdate ABC transporter substrate-binding protein, partial [Nitrospiraceae bacterium]|nr:molybdate ABC transporter substrate-binding protein [Nitrospiraceae bacterium]